MIRGLRARTMTSMQITGPIGTAVTGMLAGEQTVRRMYHLMVACAILIALLVLGGAILMLFRRWLLGKGRRHQTVDALAQIERLHRRGALSDGEFDRARRALLGRQSEDNQAKDKRVERADDEG